MRLFSIANFVFGLRNLWLHKLRSLLTSLGIIFGVAAVICMLSISEGASADEMRMIRLLGTQNVIVNSVKPRQSSQASAGNTNMMEYGITYDDLALIEATIPHVERVVPLKTVSFSVSRGQYQYPARVVGTTPDFFNVVNISVSTGRALNDLDMTPDANICVIGDVVRRELFPFEDPIGQNLIAKRNPIGVPFTVVGVLKPVDTAGARQRGVEERNLNAEVLVPYTAALSQFSEITMRRQAGTRELTKIDFSSLYIAADDLENVLPISQMVARVFEYGHDELDYEVRVPLARLKLAEKKKRNNQLVLGFIAGISLLVGGIGIMNIMLATVTERTREIGIRRALGARQRDISAQFLVETVLLSTTGGAMGVVLGLTGSRLLSTLAQWTPIVSVWSVVVSFGLSVLVGIFFGMYPAIAAAKLDPIDALRHE